ncbi:MAG: OmpA family protein [Bacteroidetes bacterium]|nr:OmpA family protein [Bacteroidota bacterium]
MYFQINQWESEQHHGKIDSLISALGSKAAKVKILGYADFLNTDRYNVLLSQKRADNIKSYLLKKTPGSKIAVTACKGNGEKASKDNGSKEGDASQRRVELIIETVAEAKVVDAGEKQEGNSKKNTGKEPKKKIEDLSKGESMTIKGLNFEPGRHFLTKESVPVLQQLLKTMQKNKTLKIEIQGHVCCTPGEEDGMDYDTHNYKLSENRAKAIYDYLISKGIEAERLSYKGFGHSKPKYPEEATPYEEQMNRRVEILVVEK